MKTFIVDAFTEAGKGGNRAGVSIIPENRDFPPAEEMQRTASVMGYSETVFIRILNHNEFALRYFTPVAEVELCGHATIAAFKVLKHLGIISGNSTGLICQTLAGEIKIELEEPATIYMDMAKPEYLGRISENDELEELYRTVGLSFKTQLAGGLKLLPEIISTGLPDIMLPVISIRDLDAINPDFKTLSALSRKYNVIGVHAFAGDFQEECTHVRNFAPLYGIYEECATGTSNGALTYYAYRHGLLNGRNSHRLTFIQGEKMGRPSKIKIRLNVSGALNIQVGGEAEILNR